MAGECHIQSNTIWTRAATHSHTAWMPRIGQKLIAEATSNGAATFIEAICSIMCAEKCPRSYISRTHVPATRTAKALAKAGVVIRLFKRLARLTEGLKMIEDT